MVKTLSELIHHLPAATRSGADVAITAPVVESAASVQRGGVFVARRGLTVDGHDFIGQAIERGAAAIVGERDITGLPVPYVRVPDPQAALGVLAAAYHDFPSHKLTVIGVTGTDGKTTTTALIHNILRLATGGKAGTISTIAADLGDTVADTGFHVTTPHAPDVQAYLAQMAANGLTHCVLEMTSIGLAEKRLNGTRIHSAVMTNVTHEHLDYHGSWEAYRDAKALMFRMLADTPSSTIAVINADDPSADYFAAIPADVCATYGAADSAAVRVTAISHHPDGTRFDVQTGDSVESYRLQLAGAFNVSNALAAIACTRALGIPAAFIRDGLAGVAGVSGRMERIDEGQDFIALVDFAHTPNALAQALKAGREMVGAGGRLIAVFGSAGLRDVQKRRMMAETSAQLADISVLTAEDPRTESLDDILAMMADGCIAQGGEEGRTFFRVADRGRAIHQACVMARAGDVVMVCGKGHEQSMCFDVTEYAWDDRDATRAALRGAPLATLPTAT
ncbi:MAG: UDP-N-acetylmuramoyl-L-alanyl-D-glutamate--2,6-diaminopimelate ligase [Anaerolineaceae bacterium]|nr:MAG: UDP-N-acetylmuramoyl-L-alanyl-D-glutamate--2,6-diaminopimelate ligase [Anaerolineaceae bacterium]